MISEKMIQELKNKEIEIDEQFIKNARIRDVDAEYKSDRLIRLDIELVSD